jgi:hypothetical protein
MPEIAFVFPNLSDIRQRGGLSSRLEFARDRGCHFLEVPADFIKNSSEVERTGLEMGMPLTPAAIAEIYDEESELAPLPYILHTEPSLPRMDAYGVRSQARLSWYDPNWTGNLIEMIVAIAERLGKAPAAVEIHPGDRRNRDDALVQAMIAIRAAFEERFGVVPAVLLENRTGQFIQDGPSIVQFWNRLCSTAPELIDDCGIVLDVQQLYTVTRDRFSRDLAGLPLDAIRAFHVHAKHRAPALRDSIPWPEVFSFMRCIDRNLLINPEVHHLGQVEPTIAFCRAMLDPDV